MSDLLISGGLKLFAVIACDFFVILDDKSFAFDTPMKQPQKSNIMCLSRGLTEADRQIRSQVIVAETSDKELSTSSEKVWQENGYFGDINPDFSIHKRDFPENALTYVNQAYLSMKEGNMIIYCDYVLLGQILALKNPPENLDEALANDETKTLVKIFVSEYDRTNGKFLGVKETLGYIMLSYEADETFFTYGYKVEQATILCCYSKQPMPNIFRGTSFSSHKLEIYTENKAKSSDLLFYLPSITDRKEQINRYKDQVALVPVSSTIADFELFAPEGYSFSPLHLNLLLDNENARLTLYGYFANACKVSNANLMQNVYALMKEKDIDHKTLKWGASMPQSKVDYGKFSTGF